MGTLREAALGLEGGLKGKGFVIRAGPAAPGRSAGEEDLHVFIETPRAEGHLLFLKLYHGRGPHHLPWAELFGIDEGFYGSEVERKLLGHLARHLGPGAALYVEYEGDEETREGLTRGFPPAATRLGFVLWRLGFTWFKDWYYPEGGLEGGRKLQGEKPLDEEARARHVSSMKRELGVFLRKAPSSGGDAFLKAAVERAKHAVSWPP
jgi:hypothetical protein